MKSRRGKWILFAAVLLSAGGIAAVVMNRAGRAGTDDQTSAARVPEQPPVAVRTVLPRRMDMETGVSYIGTVFSRTEVRIIARLPGTVTELAYREGDAAPEGAVLARIDAPEIRAQVERLTVDRDYWARRHEADKRLVERNALAPEQADAGERSLKTPEAALAEARSQLEKTRERAPFSGTVLSRFVEPGQSVMPGTPVLLFGSTGGELRAEIVEEDLRRGIRPGTAADIRFETGEALRSRVAEVSPAAGGATRTFTVKVPLPSGRPGSTPRRGSSLRVTFVLESFPGTLTLPVEAVADKTSDPHIFLIRDGAALREPVRPGIESGGRIAVDFPWNGTDRAAVSNLEVLRDGDPVFPVEIREDMK